MRVINNSGIMKKSLQKNRMHHQYRVLKASTKISWPINMCEQIKFEKKGTR